MIRLTERKLSTGETSPILIDPDDISVVGTDEHDVNGWAVLRFKSRPDSFVWVTESIDEIERRLKDAVAPATST